MRHSARSYDAEQTNRSSSYSGERGSRQKRHPLAMDGRVSPEPRMAGGDLGALAAAHIVCAAPCLGSGARAEVC
ncbi:MAG: hypothetical protein P4L59_09160 [Desulfosporosinus sp.]|nr:hypothetical protein [Desulfosporosinus sp.]